MLVNLYLHSDALKYNGTDSECDFKKKFTDLMSDLNTIRNQYGKDNVIKISSTLYDGSIPLYCENNIYDIAASLDYEEKNLIFSIFGNDSEIFDLSLEKIEEMSVYQDGETECHTLVYLNKPIPPETTYPIIYMTFDKYEIIYGKESWTTVRRQVLGNHPGSAHDFVEECKKYFTNIIFHPNCETSIEGYLNLIPRKIVYYLSCMNDKLQEYISKTGISDENELLAEFCGKYNFDDAGTRQATTKKKDLYQYKFLKCGCEDVSSNYKTITCDPHMKISYCDSNCKSPIKKIRGRIYFHFGDDEIAKNKLLIGSIGPHVA